MIDIRFYHIHISKKIHVSWVKLISNSVDLKTLISDLG